MLRIQHHTTQSHVLLSACLRIALPAHCWLKKHSMCVPFFRRDHASLVISCVTYRWACRPHSVHVVRPAIPETSKPRGEVVVKDSSSASVPCTASVSASVCSGRTVSVHLDKEGLRPEGLSGTNDVDDDLHDVKVFTRLPVWTKITDLESTNVSQRGCAVDQEYDGLCDVCLLECQCYRSQFSTGAGGVISSYTNSSVGVCLVFPSYTGAHW